MKHFVGFVVVLFIVYIVWVVPGKVWAVPTGELWLQANPPVRKVGENVQIRMMLNTGDAQLNVVYVRLSFDPQALDVTECLTLENFQGIFGGDACAVEDGAIVLRIETTQETGPKGEIELARITMQTLEAGDTTVNVEPQTQFVVQEGGDGRSMNLPLAGTRGETITVRNQSALTPTSVPPPTESPSVESLLAQLRTILEQLKNLFGITL